MPKCSLKNEDIFLFALMWYVSLVVLFHYSQSKIVFSFQQTNVTSHRNGLVNCVFFYSRAVAHFQSLSEFSSLAFIFRQEIACEQAHLWVPHVDGKVEVCKRGVWCGSVKEVSLPWSLISLVSMVSHSHPIEWERETLGRRLKFMSITWVFFKSECLCRLGKRIPCFIQISFWGIISFTLTTYLMNFALIPKITRNTQFYIKNSK